MKEIAINNTINNTINNDGLPYVIIRTYSAGVFAGYLVCKGQHPGGFEVKLKQARRLWYWSGAATLSQLAVDGTNKPGECQFPTTVPSIELVAIEIIPTTEKAKQSIEMVPIWTA